ncbi:chemotaxis protein CheW [Priestia megaterium]|uniref:chemotaxis protein CheW n=1 Tax=Priestia megaterium TaxID=1404 RepID=UPI00177DDAA0|nr:chemotaxis protein CheW [Priestia megaterium]MBD8113045.1 purine-binding chemotaxis protein CheW [Priestia megaterium]
MKIIVFQLGDEEYGISVEEVQSIEKIQHITRVPGVKKYVKGVINLRGVITPIIDLRTRFNLQEQLNHELTRIIMVRLNDVVDIDEKTIASVPETVEGTAVEYLNGVVKVDSRLIVLLNLPKVLSLEDHLQ